LKKLILDIHIPQNIMKRTGFFLLGLSLLLIISCSKDDEPDYLTPLVGTWEAFSQVFSECTDPDEEGTLTCTGGPCFEVAINSNGTYVLTNNITQSSETGTVSVDATTITICETGDTDCSGDIYTLSGNTLVVIVADDEDTGCTITINLQKK
jgi:hypothetical protein